MFEFAGRHFRGQRQGNPSQNVVRLLNDGHAQVQHSNRMHIDDYLILFVDS